MPVTAGPIGDFTEKDAPGYRGSKALLLDERGRLRHRTLLVLGGRSLAWALSGDGPIEEGAKALITRFLAGGCAW